MQISVNAVRDATAAASRASKGRKDRFRLTILFLTEMAVLLLPAAVNGGPVLFPDVIGYWSQGRSAVYWITQKLSPHGGVTIPGTTVQNSHVVRSAFYALLTYLSAELSLWLLIGIQAVIVIWLLHLVFGLVCPNRSQSQRAGFVVILGLTSTLSFVVSSAMPDGFTPILALSLTLLILYWDALGWRQRAVLLVLIVASVVMHVSNLPIAVGIVAVSALLRLRTVWHERLLRYSAVCAAIGLGAAAMLAVGIVVFKEWSLSPHAPIFMMARSIEDGPGKLYLAEHCPQIGLAMCNHLDKLDVNSADLIWSEDPAKGVYSVVSPDEQARLRAEDKRVFLAAALEHPWMQACATAKNWLAQLLDFTLQDYYIPSYVEINGGQTTFVPSSLWTEQKPWQLVLDFPEYLVVVIGFAAGLYYYYFGSLDRWAREFFLLIVAAVAMNALVATLSITAARYQARVVWLLPMVGLLFVFHEFGAQKSVGRQAQIPSGDAELV